MRQPGAVSVVCPGSGPWRALQSVLAAVSVLVGVAWLALTWSVAPTPAWGLAGLLGVGAGAAVWQACRPEAVTLGWDGSRWTIASASAVEPVSFVTMDVMLDLGGCLVLRAGAGSRWLAVHRSRAGPAFADLCTALYAQHGPRRSFLMPPERPNP